MTAYVTGTPEELRSEQAIMRGKSIYPYIRGNQLITTYNYTYEITKNETCNPSEVKPQPGWGKGAIANLVAWSLYLAATYAIEIAFLAAFGVAYWDAHTTAAELASGCIGGGLSVYMNNLLLGEKAPSAQIASVVDGCINGAAINYAFHKVHSDVLYNAIANRMGQYLMRMALYGEHLFVTNRARLMAAAAAAGYQRGAHVV